MPASGKSLQKGSTPPGPVPEGQIRIYSMRFCPYAARILLVLEAKGIKYETININLINKPEWFSEKTPLGLIPVLEMEKGQVIYESPIICDYLDEAYPGKKLNPVDPYEKAKQKMLVEHCSKVATSTIKALMVQKAGEDIAAPRAIAKEQIIKFEQLVPGTRFLGGDTVSMVDYMVWPWFERLALFGVKEVLNDTPKLKKWVAVMMQDPAVKAVLISPDVYEDFLKLLLKDNPASADVGL